VERVIPTAIIVSRDLKAAAFEGPRATRGPFAQNKTELLFEICLLTVTKKINRLVTARQNELLFGTAAKSRS
jgi:hypothetical protein